MLLSPVELRLFREMLRLVPAKVCVAPKVRVADVVTPLNPTRADLLARVAQKHLDFVLFSPLTGRILAALELDDRSHLAAQRMRRDRFVEQLLQACGVPFLRVQAAPRYLPSVIRQQLALLLGRGPRSRDKRWAQESAARPIKRARTHSTMARCSGATGRIYTSAMAELAECPSQRRMSPREQPGREPNSVAPRWRRT